MNELSNQLAQAGATLDTRHEEIVAMLRAQTEQLDGMGTRIAELMAKFPPGLPTYPPQCRQDDIIVPPVIPPTPDKYLTAQTVTGLAYDPTADPEPTAGRAWTDWAPPGNVINAQTTVPAGIDVKISNFVVNANGATNSMIRGDGTQRLWLQDFTFNGNANDLDSLFNDAHFDRAYLRGYTANRVYRPADRCYECNGANFFDVKEDGARGCRILNDITEHSHDGLTGGHGDMIQFTGATETAGVIICGYRTTQGGFLRTQGLNGGSISNVYVGNCYLDNSNPVNGHRVLALDGTHDNVYIENSIFVGPISMGGTYTNVYLNNVGFSAEHNPPDKFARPGITIGPDGVYQV